LEYGLKKLSNAKIQNVLRKEHPKALYIKTVPQLASVFIENAYDSLTLTPVSNEK
jgi:hypothetical protein